MTEKNPHCYHISASAVSAFKACPTRFRLAYREGLRPAEDTDAQRVGTNWHSLHEVYYDAYAAEQANLIAAIDSGGGDDMIPERASEYALAAVVDHLNERYENVPASKSPEEWEVERQILLRSFLGYLWYFQNDPIEILVSEVKFELPVYTPKLGKPLPKKDAVCVGLIDHIVRWNGMVGNVERKSTSRSIDHDSDYWEKLPKDTQVSMYALAFRTLAEEGALADMGIREDDRYGNTLYDVWHKPTIKPAKLTQGDTAEFIQTGKYCDETFTVVVSNERTEGEGKDAVQTADVTVDGQAVEAIPGKKGFAIRESPEMYGARLMQDIMERPEFYYARREVARTDNELRRFRVDVFNIYQAMRLFDSNGVWYENEQQCRATFPCPYIPVCYGGGANGVCANGDTPAGFKRIFTDLTIEGD